MFFIYHRVPRYTLLINSGQNQRKRDSHRRVKGGVAAQAALCKQSRYMGPIAATVSPIADEWATKHVAPHPPIPLGPEALQSLGQCRWAGDVVGICLLADFFHLAICGTFNHDLQAEVQICPIDGDACYLSIREGRTWAVAWEHSPQKRARKLVLRENCRNCFDRFLPCTTSVKQYRSLSWYFLIFFCVFWRGPFPLAPFAVRAHSEDDPHTEGTFTGTLLNVGDLRRNGGSRELALWVRQSSPESPRRGLSLRGVAIMTETAMTAETAKTVKSATVASLCWIL